MDNAVIVYESMFGGTRRVAGAVADGLAQSAQYTVVEVGQAPTVIGADVDLLVVGAPTHAFGMSTPDSRREAQSETTQPVISRELGVREWLASLIVLSTGGLRHPRQAALGTRIRRPRSPTRWPVRI
jgi:menaquinone-dependent protoporphyrinogen IX oxidase